MGQEASFVKFKWRCPDCPEGRCEIVNLADDFAEEVAQIGQGILLEPVELEILSTLNEESRKMAAGEISSLIDITYQLAMSEQNRLRWAG